MSNISHETSFLTYKAIWASLNKDRGTFELLPWELEYLEERGEVQIIDGVNYYMGKPIEVYSDEEDVPMAVELKKFMDALPDDSELTIDDFYDYVGLDDEYRNDFATAALFDQYYKLCEENDDKEERI